MFVGFPSWERFESVLAVCEVVYRHVVSELAVVVRYSVYDCDVMPALFCPLVHDVELLANESLVTVWLAGSDDFGSSDIEGCTVGLPLLCQVECARRDGVVPCVFDDEAVGR